MYMFLPFLLALGTAISVLAGKKKLSYALWAALVLVTVLSFKHHVTDPLSLSF
ncbi:DUF5993 family protein [Alcaligenes sp. WGS1538]|uniref:DUF5993 family protein n=1 Tax=Alcaligenes sp. WGS1538 TaxID=3366811 RepID=UPI00372D5C2D